MDACPTGAISLDENEGVPTINLALCDECLSCLEVCPTDAIQQAASYHLVPAVEGEVLEGEIIGGEVTPAPAAGLPVMTRQSGQLATMAGTALTFVASWLLPRAADVLVGAIERRLTSGASSVPSASSLRTGNRPLTRQMGGGRGNRSRQRQRRRRGR